MPRRLSMRVAQSRSRLTSVALRWLCFSANSGRNLAFVPAHPVLGHSADVALDPPNSGRLRNQLRELRELINLDIRHRLLRDAVAPPGNDVRTPAETRRAGRPPRRHHRPVARRMMQRQYCRPRARDLDFQHRRIAQQYAGTTQRFSEMFGLLSAVLRRQSLMMAARIATGETANMPPSRSVSRSSNRSRSLRSAATDVFHILAQVGNGCLHVLTQRGD